MERVIQAIADIAEAVTPEQLSSLVSVLEQHRDDPRRCRFKLSRLLSGVPQLYEAFDSAWTNSPICSPADLCLILRTAAHFSPQKRIQSPLQLAWTGPQTSKLQPRRMDAALREVIEAAKHRLFIVSFVFYPSAGLIQSLKNASTHGVQIQILLESSNAYGGTLDDDPITQMKLALADEPASQSIQYYRWLHNENGCVHAKCAIADSEIAYISSANLTGRAMDDNMELGVVIKNHNEPAILQSHFDELIKRGVIAP